MKTVLKKIGGFFKSVGRWFKNHAPTKRRLIQLYAALLTNANLKGFITGQIYTGGSKVMCVPGLNCYSCPGAIGACPLGSLQNALASSGTRAPVYVLGILALFGIILGRTICGFLCPMGLCQDLAYKIKTPKLKKSRATRILSYLKYILLVVLVIAVPLAFVGQERLIPAFCKFICPAGTFGGALSLLFHPDNADMYAMLGPMFTWKFALFCALFVACVFIYRAFCRFFCPLGAIYGFFNKIALLGVNALDLPGCLESKTYRMCLADDTWIMHNAEGIQNYGLRQYYASHIRLLLRRPATRAKCPGKNYNSPPLFHRFLLFCFFFCKVPDLRVGNSYRMGQYIFRKDK